MRGLPPQRVLEMSLRKNNTPKKLGVEYGNFEEVGASSDVSGLMHKAVPAVVCDPIKAVFERKAKPKAVAPVVAQVPAVEQPKKVTTPPKQEGDKLTARIKVVNLDAVKIADHCKGKSIVSRQEWSDHNQLQGRAEARISGVSERVELRGTLVFDQGGQVSLPSPEKRGFFVRR